MGGLGYFPTYALGNLYAAQFFECFAKCHPSWAEQIKHGNLEFIKEWLKEHLHKHGRRYTPHEIVQKITGRPLEEKPYINYLESKFKKIYNF
jgi:carboxypeptidase Taq